MRLRSVVWTDPRRIFESLPLKTEDGAVVLLTSHSCWTVGRAANPVLTVMQLDDGTPSTILGGVREVVSSGMYPLAALVFFASVALLMLKLVGLTVMLGRDADWACGMAKRSDPAVPCRAVDRALVDD